MRVMIGARPSSKGSRRSPSTASPAAAPLAVAAAAKVPGATGDAHRSSVAAQHSQADANRPAVVPGPAKADDENENEAVENENENEPAEIENENEPAEHQDEQAEHHDGDHHGDDHHDGGEDGHDGGSGND